MGCGKLAKAEGSGVHSGTAADSLLWDRTDSALCLSFPISKAEMKVPDLPIGWRCEPEVPGERCLELVPVVPVSDSWEFQIQTPQSRSQQTFLPSHSLYQLQTAMKDTLLRSAFCRKRTGQLKRAQVPKDTESPAGTLDAVLWNVLYITDNRQRFESRSLYKLPVDKCTL